MKVVVALGLLIAGCDVVFGLGGRTDDAGLAIDAPPPCGSPDRLRNPAGCACELVSAVASCYLGDPGIPGETMSSCAVSGQVTCRADHVWSECEGASMPTTEVCFDNIDNDCDGTVDDGCSCADTHNLCIDPATAAPYNRDIALGSPMPIVLTGSFAIIGLSRSAMPGAVISTRGATCSGAMDECAAGTGACAGWYVSMLQLTAEPPWFVEPGTFPIAVRVQDAGACTSATRTIPGTVIVTQ